MSSRVGAYDHIGVKVPIDVDQLAEAIEQSSYGTHQFLSALVRIRRRDPSIPGTHRFELTEGIAKLLDEGGF
jgi:hypothetical protein